MHLILKNVNLWATLILSLGMMITGTVTAGQYNEELSPGDEAPAWDKLPGVDGKQHSFQNLEKYKVVVVVFTCNTCPYAHDYEGRINELAKKYAGDEGKVAVVAINVNKVKGDLLPDMIERAKEKGLVYPYLYDETQQIAKAYGAMRTPEFFVLNQARKVVYMGAFDDNTKEAAVTKHHVEDAISAALREEVPTTAETPPVGCAIRYERTRRAR